MDHQSQSFILVMAILGVVGIVGTVAYYFFRFGFKTDFDKDLEKVDPKAAKGQVFWDDQEKVKEPPPAADDSPQQEELVAVEPVSQVEPDLQQVPAALAVEKNVAGALTKTRETFFSRLKSVFSENKLSDSDLENLEEVLYTSDLGPQTVQRLMDSIEEKLSSDQKRDLGEVTSALKAEMQSIFKELDIDPETSTSVENALKLSSKGEGLQVWLIVGVNGAGKTTTIGKLANVVAKSGKKVMVAAGDTFRAAAGDQLKVWSERAQVEIFAPPNVTDPSAVAFDACTSAKAKDFDILIVDTAGRLHTQANLMQELEKLNRVIKKVIPKAPHETLLVIDANSGQNALIQGKQFNEAVDLTGAVLTKLDGSAKGGVAVGLAHELQLPIRLIGVGEGIEDIRPFEAAEFVNSIL